MDALLTKLFDGICPAVLAWYRDRTDIAQKLSRLDMLVTKIRSVVEVSQKTEIESESLKKWQQDFQAAVTQGDEVLRKLQDQVNSSSSSSTSSGISSIKSLFSGTEGEKKLNSTIELLEWSSAEVKDFLKILKLELQQKRKSSRRKRELERDLQPIKPKRRYFNRERVEYVNICGTQGISSNWRLECVLSSRTLEDLAAVEDLAAEIQSALDMAMEHGAVEDGWFGQLIAKLREAMKEGNSVASAIKSNIYCVDDQISDEVGEIVTAVRLRLESVQDDLEDFTNLAEVEELVRQLPPAGPSNAHT